MSGSGPTPSRVAGHPTRRRPPEQLTRNWNELLQELRVMQTGVQILTGFLLTVPFSDKFSDLEPHQRVIYLTVLGGAVMTTALIVAPVSFHRTLFRQQQRDWLVVAAHRSARAGLTMLSLVSAGVVLLVFDIVVGTVAGIVAGVAVVTVFGILWYGVPRLLRHRHLP
ncbi:MAG TPA: DUF6328 family protein [Nocardioides sp.]|nr:DUF6328 family protein [Nocardioides sp.]